MTGPYPALEDLAVIGDRRTAVMLDADATMVWLCLPWYNDPPVLASILDSDVGGSWQLRIQDCVHSERAYVPREPIHRTRSSTSAGEAEIIDFMPLPETDRSESLEPVRLVVRLVRCLSGRVDVVGELSVAPGVAMESSEDGSVALMRDGAQAACLEASFPIDGSASGCASWQVSLDARDTAWMVLRAVDGTRGEMQVVDAARWLADTERYWRETWPCRLGVPRPETDDAAAVLDSASVLHLLTCAPAGATLAAPTSSLPERLGGDRNYDYRYSWIRDASLSLATLAMVGDVRGASAYMDWISGLGSGTAAPLQVVYAFNGGHDIPEREVPSLAGYAGSAPVRFGNRAHAQLQLDSLGYFVDCAYTFLQAGGAWREEYWRVVRDAAGFTAASWQQPDSGIWELPTLEHWTSSKVMSWVALDRALRIAEHIDEPAPRAWAEARDALRVDVLERGWHEETGSFRQHYGSTSTDASLLLIPLMDFLPVDDERVVSTVARIRQELEVDGFVYRFDPEQTPGSEGALPLGEHEGAFVPCSFWLASTLARCGDVAGAKRIVDTIRSACPLGLYPEQVDAATRSHLGNTPLLFSHAEHLRAAHEIEQAAERGASDPTTVSRPAGEGRSPA